MKAPEGKREGVERRVVLKARRELPTHTSERVSDRVPGVHMFTEKYVQMHIYTENLAVLSTHFSEA